MSSHPVTDQKKLSGNGAVEEIFLSRRRTEKAQARIHLVKSGRKKVSKRLTLHQLAQCVWRFTLTKRGNVLSNNSRVTTFLKGTKKQIVCKQRRSAIVNVQIVL